ncbi:MAG: CHAP domain-containing protein, partial [bacterium]|nr:CHAP domain-containing protein [bacterium]
NDLIDHVAFVEKYENGYVYTIEGNVGGNSSMSRAEKAKVRKVVQRKYKKNSLHLYGYGVPEY